MSAFPNRQNISKISFKQNIQAFCTLGQEFYTNQVTVTMTPGETIPDYCEVEATMRHMAGKPMTIEDCVFKVFEYLMMFDPSELTVSSFSDDAVHFPVTVTKTL